MKEINEKNLREFISIIEKDIGIRSDSEFFSQKYTDGLIDVIQTLKRFFGIEGGKK